LAFALGSDRIIHVLAAAGLALAAAAPLRAEPPARVVSMNLCTDQLALMLAREGQLISVSDIAQDPLTSAMHEEASAVPVNHGGAEEIFLLQPDLVLAGVWSDPTTVSMLRSLGIEVAQMGVANSLADVPDRVREVATLLGREDAAEALIRRFETDLARLAGPADGPGDGGPLTLVMREIRLPRAILAAMIGASRWAFAGAAMQGYLRNPLAEPGLIGVSGSAALGAVWRSIRALGGGLRRWRCR
jgi:ABC-type Fe3+-siderophore transport system permease subunit